MESVRKTLADKLSRPRSSMFVKLLLAGLKLWHRFHILALNVSGKKFSVQAGFSPEQTVAEGEAVPVAKEVDDAATKGPTYLFRGDDFYTGGSLGFVLNSEEADEADIQTPWEHVLEKEGGPKKSRGDDDGAGRTSRYTSFSITRAGAAKFTKKNMIQKAVLDELRNLPTVRIHEPADVEAMMRAHPKKKVQRLAGDVRHACHPAARG